MKKKYLKILTLASCLFFTLLLNAQSKEQIAEIVKNYDLVKLKKLEKQFILKERLEKQQAYKLAKVNNWPIFKSNEDGSFDELQRVSENGQPIYYSIDNDDAANSTRTNLINTNGGLGLTLDGQGMIAGVWDGGPTRPSHQEYTGRILIQDGAVTLNGNSFHACHVSGTVGAAGINAAAKGMAPVATVNTYDWTNDEAEVTAAAANGLLLSNHSYGVPLASGGANLAGKYDGAARAWDQIAYNAPFYLNVYSAGNDGNNNNSNPTTPGFDKLIGEKNSKNNLVVANAQDANIDANGNLIFVNINSGSSEGPSDDFRVKPDIAGNGTQLFSSWDNADNGYNTISGTSMSAPNVTGTLLLFQQHYNDVNGSFMRSATLKGLATHTADDAGNIGPDANFGWGLLNAKAAVEAINGNGLTSIIEERTISQGATYSVDVTTDGLQPLLASITWTDVPGVANTGAANDATPALVNDLDIRITRAGTTFFPWRLTNNATQNAIRTGDNNVDNVERVQIDNPNAGTYTITISHKGSLQLGPQNYSLVVTGIVSDYSLTVLNPSQEACSTDSIVYNVDYFENVNGITNITADNVPAGASVLFSQTVLTNSTNFTATIDNLDGLAAGEYSFDIVGNNGNETKRKTVSFTLYTPNLDDPILLAPLTGSTDAGTTNTFTWSDDVNARDYDLEISLDPSFPTNAIFFTTNTISNSVTVNNFNLGTIYYWRVRANNTCTTSNYLDVYNFQVGTEDCSFTYTNNTVVPINNLQDNSGSFGLGNGWSVSTINVPDDINISDVIITTDITHTYIADLILFGVSPNRSNILLNGSCGAADNINATFTDSGAVLNCGTNPAVSGNVIPEESLSEAYFGEDSVGEWAFATNDNFNGDNGSINSWTLNICGIVPITTIPNFNNNLITVATNSNYTIINTDILATTNSEAPVDQIYVVTQDTQVGTLSLNGVDLNVGDTYTQEDVDTNKLTFSNTETTNNTDQYRVDILNASSGFLGNQIININIDSTLSLNDNNFNNTIGLWPNPVNDGILNIQFKKVNNGVALINIFDLQGRKVLNSKLSPKSNTFSGQINVGALSTGVYLVEINYDGFSTSKKIIIK